MKKLTLIATALVTLTGCVGDSVEISTGHVGKIQTKDGFQSGIREASKFRLPHCWTMCDRLITLDISDKQYSMAFSTYMPKDQLNMKYKVDFVLAVKPSKYEEVFATVPFNDAYSSHATINHEDVVKRYAKPQLKTNIPAIVSNFTINEIASSRSKVNNYLKAKLNDQLSTTPMIVKHIGLTEVEYPKIIIEAKERVAERKEKEAAVIQQRELDLLKAETKLLLERKKRQVELEQAKTKALVAKQLMSKDYETLLKYEAINSLAQSSNKVIVPTDMLDSIAVHNLVK